MEKLQQWLFNLNERFKHVPIILSTAVLLLIALIALSVVNGYVFISTAIFMSFFSFMFGMLFAIKILVSKAIELLKNEEK